MRRLLWLNLPFNKSVRSLAEPLQVGMDNAARRALMPLVRTVNASQSLEDHTDRQRIVETRVS